MGIRIGGDLTHRNLLLHYFPKAVFRSDFEGIADRIRALDRDIKVRVLPTNRRHPLAMFRAAVQPTISVEFNRARYFRSLRGKVFRQQGGATKSQEYRLLQAAGIPVPKWALVTPDISLDPSEWGDYVVEKPDGGARGAYVRVKRTRRVRYRPPDSLEEDNPGRSSGMIVQKLVLTGRIPISYRVMTLFGTPLLATRYEGGRDPMFTEEPGGHRKLSGSTCVSTGKGCRITTFDDPHILDLARRAHLAFPTVPVLGVDIIRDVDDGSLAVLEVNSIGGTWGLGSPGGRAMMSDQNIDLYAQFGALDRAAEALVDLCRRTAA